MKTKSEKKINIKIIIIVSVLALAVTGMATFLFIRFYEPDTSEIYGFLTEAMENTESSEAFLAQIMSTAQLTVGDNVQITTTKGYVSSEESLGDVYVYLNTKSETPSNPSADYDVTLSMFTDGEKVYDDSTGTKEEIDITVEEFNSIINEYRLYRYNENDVEKVEFDENELEEFSGSGTVTVSLSKPAENVLRAYAQTVSELTGENVKTDDLNVNSAFVTYTVFEDRISAQVCTFAVEYVSENGETIHYSVTNQVAYIDDYENGDEDSDVPDGVEEM